MDGGRRLKLMYSNMQSMNNKMGELRAVVDMEKPDIIALTETWTNECISDAFLSLDGYDMVERRDRTDTAGGRGGGISRGLNGKVGQATLKVAHSWMRAWTLS